MGAKVQWRKSAWWVVTHHERKRRHRRIGPDDEHKRQAEGVAARINAAFDARKFGILLEAPAPKAATKVPTLAEFAPRYLEGDTAHLAPTTVAVRTQHLAAKRRTEKSPEPPILPHLGELRLDEITPEKLREWWSLAVEGSTRRSKTGREYVNTLAALYHYARDLGVIGRDVDPIAPLRAMLRRRRRTQRGRADAEQGRDVRPIADPAAIMRLLAEARTESLEAYVYTLLGLDAGLRLGEACALRWGSVVWGAGEDDTSRRLRIVESRARGLGPPGPPKSGRAREVALSRRLRAALEELDRERWRPADDRLVLEGLDPSNFHGREWRQIRERSGLGSVRFKDLRDTFASQLLTAGVQLGYISGQLGHKDVAITAQHYARWVAGSDYRDPLARRPGEVPADFLARLPAAPDGSGRGEAQSPRRVERRSRRVGGTDGTRRHQGPGDPTNTGRPKYPKSLGGPSGDRTQDQRVKSPVLCQLS